MKTLGYYNGKFGPLDEMTVPMNDRACFFGDGIYEATLARDGKLFALDAHLDRMWSSAAQIRLEMPVERDELAGLLSRLTGHIDDSELLVYWQVTRGTAPRSHAFPQGVGANLWITMKPGRLKAPETQLRLTTTEDTRYLHCNVKTLNLLPNVLAAQKAEEAGCDECVFHRGDIVTECAHSNISILRDGAFITHPADRFILPGITRKLLLEECGRLGIPAQERSFTLGELFSADEVIVSSSTQAALRAVEIDGRAVGGRDSATFARLQQAYLERFRREIGERV